MGIEDDEHKKYTEALNWLVSDMLARLNRIESKLDSSIEQKQAVNRPETPGVRDALKEGIEFCHCKKQPCGCGKPIFS